MVTRTRTQTERALVAGVALVAVLVSSAAARADVKHECIAAADRGQEMRDDGNTAGAQEAFAECARDACPSIIAQSCRKWSAELEAARRSNVVPPDPEARDEVATVDAGEPSPPRASATLAPPVTLAPARSEARGGIFRPARDLTVLSLLGGAAVAAAGALAFDVASRNEAGTAAGYRATNPSDACVKGGSPTCVAWSDAVDAQNRDAIADRVLFVAAGAMLVGASLAWLLWPHAEHPAPHAMLVPSVAPGVAGIVLQGAL